MFPLFLWFLSHRLSHTTSWFQLKFQSEVDERVGSLTDIDNARVRVEPGFVLSCLVVAAISAATMILYWYYRGWNTRARRTVVDEASQDTQDYNCE